MVKQTQRTVVELGPPALVTLLTVFSLGAGIALLFSAMARSRVVTYSWSEFGAGERSYTADLDGFVAIAAEGSFRPRRNSARPLAPDEEQRIIAAANAVIREGAGLDCDLRGRGWREGPPQGRFDINLSDKIHTYFFTPVPECMTAAARSLIIALQCPLELPRYRSNWCEQGEGGRAEE